MRRRIVLGFFDMVYYSRQFKRRMELKNSARMTAVPQLDVPEILVENEMQGRDRAATKSSSGGAGIQSLQPSRAGDLLSTGDAHPHHRSWSGVSTDLSTLDVSYGHPLASPRTSGPASPSRRNHLSAFSFEVQDRLDGAGDSDEAARNGQRGSSVSPAQVREMLDDSVWMASIRRSATTTRKPGWGGGPGSF